jgi:polar amino acid transport system substrate-binding protein
VYPQLLGLLLAVALILTIVGAASLRGGSRTDPMPSIQLATGDWAPYSGEKLANYGLASTVVTAVFQQMGYQPQMHFMPWAQTEKAALSDEDDQGVRGAFPYAFTAERAGAFYYSQPIFNIQMSVFYNATRNSAAAKIKSPTDLAHFLLVPISGYRYGVDIEKYLAHMAPVEDNVAAFKLLLTSTQPVLVIEATRVGEELLSTTFALHADEIGTAALKVSSPIHFIASKRNPDNLALVRKFDATLDKMRRDGSLERVQVEAQQAIDAQLTVRLQPADSQGYIQAFPHADSTATVLLPQGTRVVVERWSRNFLEARITPTSSPERVKVRVLNGPQSGQSLYVDERTIVLP